jgi:DNA repair protein SbcC/Rad50
MAARAKGLQARHRIEHRAATAEQTAQLRACLSAADRAREVAVLLAPLQEATAQLTEARSRVQHAMKDIDRPDWESAPLDDVVADVQAARVEAERATGRERALADDVERLAALDRQAHAAQEAADEASAVAAALQATADAAPAAIDELQTQIEAGLRLDAAHDHLAALLTAAQLRHQAAVALPSAQRAAEQAEAAARGAFDDYRTAVDSRLDVVRRRIDGAAAALARQLIDGEPCVVCGSTEHPQPATASTDPPSEGDEQSAHLREEAALARRGATERAAAAAAGEVARLSLLACGESAEAAKAAVARLDDDYRLAEAARRELPSAQQALAAVQKSSAEAQHRLQAAWRREGDLQAAAGSTHTAANDLRARLAAVLGPELDIHALSERTHRRLTRLGRALDAATALRSAVAGQSDAARRVDELARAHGFTDADGAAEAMLESGTYHQLRARLEQRDQQAAADAELLADESIVAALAGDEVDLDASGRVAAAADEMYDRHAGDLRSAERTAARLDHMSDELTQQLEVWRPLQQVHDLTAGLASLVEGKSPDNAHRMSLSAYVLAARLEQVVAAANERLTPMTSGRYLLEHTVDKCAGDRKAAHGGLGLLVRDAWTGDVRDPATLSGGETFQASLALALGLADVVGQEVGGTQLQTVFVDEGFGSLDADSLDDVLDELDRLRDGGRVVGVVSHVEAMRERIPTQLRVVKGHRGGSLVSQG